MTIRGDAMLLTHGREGTEQLIGTALLLDAALGGQIDIALGTLVAGARARPRRRSWPSCARG